MVLYRLYIEIMKVNTRKIEDELVRLGWSQAKLADMLGMTRSGVSILLKKEATCLKTLNKIGEALNLDPKDLLI